MSIVEGKDWAGKKGRKFNLDQVASEARKVKMEREGETSVRGMEGNVQQKEASQRRTDERQAMNEA